MVGFSFGSILLLLQVREIDLKSESFKESLVSCFVGAVKTLIAFAMYALTCVVLYFLFAKLFESIGAL